MNALFADHECGPRVGSAEAENLSYTRRLTLRRNAQIAAGIHPVTGHRLLPLADGKTCGDCDHHFSHSRNQTWHKCELNATRGAATDIRVGWPACVAFVPESAAELDGQSALAHPGVPDGAA